MRHKKLRYKLGLEKSHRSALISNLLRSLIFHKRIHTTEAKAKATSRAMDKVITSALKGRQNSWKQVAKKVKDKEALKELFSLIVPTYEERESGGGYTRIIKTLPRKGDGAKMAFVELVGFEEEITDKEREQITAKLNRRRLRREREEEEMRRYEEEMAREEGISEGERPEIDGRAEEESGGLLKFFRRFKKKDRDPGS